MSEQTNVSPATAHREALELKANPLTPTVAIKQKLSRTPVSASDWEVENLIRNAVSEAAAKDHRWTMVILDECIAYALACHHENQALYGYVMS